MEGAGIAKTMIRSITICGLVLAIATAAGAQTVHTNPDGSRWYAGSDGNMIFCGGYAPDGKYVSCPGDDLSEKPGLMDKAKDQWGKAKEKLQEWNPLKKVDALKEEFAADDRPWRHETRNPRPDEEPAERGFLEKVKSLPGNVKQRVKNLFTPDMPWCHEIGNPLHRSPPDNCIEYIPPAANVPDTGKTNTINVHLPAVGTADPFDSAYESYQTPAASRYGRNVGRALARKAERERREAEHRRLLSTLDRREERTAEPKVKSGYQGAIGATAVPLKPLAPSGTVQRPNSDTTDAPPRATRRLTYVERNKAAERLAEKRRAKAAKARVPRRKSNYKFNYPKFGRHCSKEMFGSRIICQ